MYILKFTYIYCLKQLFEAYTSNPASCEAFIKHLWAYFLKAICEAYASRPRALSMDFVISFSFLG